MATLHTRASARLMMAPAVVMLLIWMAVPLAMTLYFSFLRYNLLMPGMEEWAGFFNYRYFLTDPAFADALVNTLLLVGGVPALQNATIIMGLPFAFVLMLVMLGLYRALRLEALQADSRQFGLRSLSSRSTSNGHLEGVPAWRLRLDRALSFPSRERTERFLTEVALPAMTDVAAHLQERGCGAQAREDRDEDGTRYVVLDADLGEERPFRYEIRPREVPVPVYGRAVPKGSDTYWRLEVHLREGGQDYDVMGYTSEQLIDDILDQYERHLEFVRMQEVAG